MPGSDNTIEVFVDSAYHGSVVFAHTRLVHHLRVTVARLRKEIGRMEEVVGRSEFRVDQLEALLGFSRY